MLPIQFQNNNNTYLLKARKILFGLLIALVLAVLIIFYPNQTVTTLCRDRLLTKTQEKINNVSTIEAKKYGITIKFDRKLLPEACVKGELKLTPVYIFGPNPSNLIVALCRFGNETETRRRFSKVYILNIKTSIILRKYSAVEIANLIKFFHFCFTQVSNCTNLKSLVKIQPSKDKDCLWRIKHNGFRICIDTKWNVESISLNSHFLTKKEAFNIFQILDIWFK